MRDTKKKIPELCPKLHGRLANRKQFSRLLHASQNAWKWVKISALALRTRSTYRIKNQKKVLLSRSSLELVFPTHHFKKIRDNAMAHVHALVMSKARSKSNIYIKAWRNIPQFKKPRWRVQTKRLQTIENLRGHRKSIPVVKTRMASRRLDKIPNVSQLDILNIILSHPRHWPPSLVVCSR